MRREPRSGSLNSGSISSTTVASSLGLRERAGVEVRLACGAFDARCGVDHWSDFEVNAGTSSMRFTAVERNWGEDMVL